MRYRLGVCLCICFLVSHTALAQQRRPAPADSRQSLEMRIDPQNLAPLVLDQRIRLMMHDGTYAEGRVIRASQTALTLRVRKSEPKDRLRRPEAELLLSAISVVHLKRSGNVAAPITLGILGGIGGFVLGAFAGLECCDEQAGMVLIPMGTSIGGAIGGNLLGRELVRKTITIYLNRDAKAP